MTYDITIGRNLSDKERFGSKGLIFLGKGYVTMGQHTSLSNNIWMDVARSHVILIAGKRGSGKSYSLGVISEELSNLPSETSSNIASLIFDTMGIFWTMKFKNEKDKLLLDSWKLKAKKLPVKVFAPFGKLEEYKDKQIPIDSTFAIKPSELESEDWLDVFNLKMTDPIGVLIQQIITNLKKTDQDYNIEKINNQINNQEKTGQEIKNTASALFQAADTWGIFSPSGEGTEISQLVKSGSTSILDLSVFSSIGAFNIRALVISLITKKIFKTRLDARKKEEIDAIQHGQDYLLYKQEKQEPLVWLFIDEAHELLPRNEKTPATDALIKVLREGRQPGISIVLATQQPGQIHKDVMTQSDIVISHRVTARPDIEALNDIMQSYLIENIRQQQDELPSLKGSAIILDDNSERIYPIRVRPRFTWHGGEAPSAIKAEVKI